jgi:rare lipoprotein A
MTTIKRIICKLFKKKTENKDGLIGYWGSVDTSDNTSKILGEMYCYHGEWIAGPSLEEREIEKIQTKENYMKKTLLSIIAILTLTLSLSFGEQGKASIYTTSCNGGTKTASGIRLVNDSNMIAHKTLPFGTLVKITNLKNNKSTTAKVVDRGPFVKGRIVDVTTGVANALGFTKKQGITTVRVEVVAKPPQKSK